MRFIGFDTETYLIAPGRQVPPLVCCQYAGTDEVHDILRAAHAEDPADIVLTEHDNGEWSALVTRGPRDAVFSAFLAEAVSGDVAFVAHNAPFDMAVMGEHCDDDDVITAIFEAYERRGVRDTKIRDQLIAIGEGWFQFDVRTRQKPRFRLSDLVQRRFGLDISGGKTDPNAWRLRYCELDGVPAKDYPDGARIYASEDAEWALRCLFDQGRSPVTTSAGPLVDEVGDVVNEVEQVQADFGLYALTAWGLRTDPVAAAAFEQHSRERVVEGRRVGVAAGFVRKAEHWAKRGGICRLCGTTYSLPEGSGSFAKRVAAAGGLPETCPTCGADGKWSKDMAAMRAKVEAAYVAQGLPIPTTEKGAISTSRETLEESGDKALQAYAKLGVFQKYLTTYVPQLQQGFTRPINPGFNVLVRSGRTSAYAPNTQNPPRSGGFRECFVPRPGHVYCSVDYDIAELKGLAQIHKWWFGTSALGDTINSGRDPHLAFGTRLLNIRKGTDYDYDAVKAISKDATHPLYEEVSGAQGVRQAAKAFNFGKPGGLGNKSMVKYAKNYGVLLTEETAKELSLTWLDELPEMSQYFQVIAALCSGGPTAVQQAVSGRIRGDCTYTAACNTFFQGIVVDFAKAALWRVVRECMDVRGGPGGSQGVLYGARPVLFIHDEIIMEIPADGLLNTDTGNGWSAERTTEAADRLAQIMVEEEQRYLPDIVASASPALMLRWWKGAKEVRQNGVLLPWEPPKEHNEVLALEKAVSTAAYTGDADPEELGDEDDVDE